MTDLYFLIVGIINDTSVSLYTLIVSMSPGVHEADSNMGTPDREPQGCSRNTTGYRQGPSFLGVPYLGSSFWFLWHF